MKLPNNILCFFDESGYLRETRRSDMNFDGKHLAKVWGDPVEYIPKAEADARIAELEREVEEWEALAKSWEGDYDKLKEKYEPMVLVLSEVGGPNAEAGE